MTDRPLNDMVAEALWRRQLIPAPPPHVYDWADVREDRRARWCRDADHFLRIAEQVGFEVRCREQDTWRPIGDVAADVLDGVAAEIERGRG